MKDTYCIICGKNLHNVDCRYYEGVPICSVCNLEYQKFIASGTCLMFYAIKKTCRESVSRFASEMEHTLSKHEDKGGWEKIPNSDLIHKAAHEMMELNAEIEKKDLSGIMHESVDLANFAMMIYDNAWREHTSEPIEDDGGDN